MTNKKWMQAFRAGQKQERQRALGYIKGHPQACARRIRELLLSGPRSYDEMLCVLKSEGFGRNTMQEAARITGVRRKRMSVDGHLIDIWALPMPAGARGRRAAKVTIDVG